MKRTILVLAVLGMTTTAFALTPQGTISTKTKTVTVTTPNKTVTVTTPKKAEVVVTPSEVKTDTTTTTNGKSWWEFWKK